MAHARSHRRGGGGMFASLLLGGVVILALLIGWLVWGGTPNIAERASNIDIRMPQAPVLPQTPDPEPLPVPTPARPG